MTSLRTLAWGLIIIGLDFTINGRDLVPDPIGWCLAAYALASLKDLHPALGVATAAGLAGLLVSLPEWLGAGGWPVSAVSAIAQLVVVFATCTALIALVPGRSVTANRIRWWLVGLGGLATVIGLISEAERDDGLVVLVLPLVIASLGVAVWFLVFLFQCARLDPAEASPTVPG